MPHCIIEYSRELAIAPDLLEDLNHLLCIDGEINIENLKSRLICLDQVLVGQNNEQLLVALTLKLLPGRNTQWKQELGHKLLRFLKSRFDTQTISVEIVEMNKEFYFK